MRRRLIAEDPESGYIAVLVALCLPLFIGLCALAIDVAMWYVDGAKAQKAADAAALAGAVYLPSQTQTARSVALDLVGRNGFTVGDGTSVNVNEDESPTRLRVTVSTKVHNTFGGFLGHPTTIITRTAVADFAGPVEMGSPCNVLGNEDMETSGVGSSHCSGQSGVYWLNISGTNVNKVNGDAYASGYCTVPQLMGMTIDGCSSVPGRGVWGDPPNNSDYNDNAQRGSNLGYLYSVHVARPVTRLTIQAFDLAWVPVGVNCDSSTLDGAAALPPTPEVPDPTTRYAQGPGPFCTGDSQESDPQGDGTSSVVTTVRVYNPAPSTSQPLAGGLACAPVVLPGWDNKTPLTSSLDPTSPTYDKSLAATFRQWSDLCPEFLAPKVGDYIVRITTTGGTGQNRFALRATTGDSAGNANVSVAALGRESLYNSVPAGTTDFYLARLTSGAAGHVLTVGFFDLADATQPVQVTVLQPDSDAPFASCTSEPEPGATGDAPLSGCTVVATRATNGGLWQVVNVPIDADYRCPDDRDPSKCWVRVRLTTSAAQQDTTTWRAELEGDPVRLVE